MQGLDFGAHRQGLIAVLEAHALRCHGLRLRQIDAMAYVSVRSTRFHPSALSAASRAR